MKEKALRIGWLLPLIAFWSVLAPFGAVASLVVPFYALEGDDIANSIFGGLLAMGALTSLVSVLVLVRLQIVDASVAGRGRLTVLARTGALALIPMAALGWLLRALLFDPGFRALGAVDLAGRVDLRLVLSSLDAVAASQGNGRLLFGAAIGSALVWIVQLCIGVSFWFLVRERIRRTIWLIIDVPLGFLFIVALWTLPFQPREPDGDVVLPAIALTIASLAAIRFFARFLSPLLDSIEQVGFGAMVAARMLRARKSGFLTVIGSLSVLAVSFSSMTLTTTLSVMGGFREDLQRKILGNNAHVVIDKEYGTFEGWDPVLSRVRAEPGVVGASPYLLGEVMITSATNLGGAILRGIEPDTIGSVTDLPRNLRDGRLEYLSEPERLLDLSISDMNRSLFPSRDRRPVEAPPEVDETGALVPGAFHDDPLEPSEAGGLLREIDAMLEGLVDEGLAASEAGERELGDRASDPGPTELLGGALGSGELGSGELGSGELGSGELSSGEQGGGPELRQNSGLRQPRPLRPARDVLPGLIIGQELARSLRLHLGDEVNVVSPLGDLGPSGPIPRSRPFRVAGIFYSGMYEYDMKVAYTDLASAQRFFSAGDAISGIEVKVEHWEHAESAAKQIQSVIPRDDLRVRSWQEVNRNLFGALQLEKLAMFITLGIAILVASFCIIGTLVLMVQEKRREVGILKAMGAEDRHIVAIFMIQGLFIGLLGASSGLALGWIVCFVAEHFGVVQLDPEVYYIDRLPIHTEPYEFASVGVAAVIVCLLATVYPAILGSRLRPIDALRDT